MTEVLTREVDPVCGMTVDPSKAAGSAEYRGRTYYFCSRGCLARFQAAPEQYVTGISTPTKPSDARQSAVGRTYVCPMDPEVRKTEPGVCPKCGMALEPDLSDASTLMKVEYTCPMHPEIVRDQPGACPICGMALEPRMVRARRHAKSRARRHDAPILDRASAWARRSSC